MNDLLIRVSPLASPKPPQPWQQGNRGTNVPGVPMTDAEGLGITNCTNDRESFCSAISKGQAQLNVEAETAIRSATGIEQQQPRLHDDPSQYISKSFPGASSTKSDGLDVEHSFLTLALSPEMAQPGFSRRAKHEVLAQKLEATAAKYNDPSSGSHIGASSSSRNDFELLRSPGRIPPGHADAKTKEESRDSWDASSPLAPNFSTPSRGPRPLSHQQNAPGVNAAAFNVNAFMTDHTNHFGNPLHLASSSLAPEDNAATSNAPNPYQASHIHPETPSTPFNNTSTFDGQLSPTSMSNLTSPQSTQGNFWDGDPLYSFNVPLSATSATGGHDDAGMQNSWWSPESISANEAGGFQQQSHSAFGFADDPSSLPMNGLMIQNPQSNHQGGHVGNLPRGNAFAAAYSQQSQQAQQQAQLYQQQQQMHRQSIQHQIQQQQQQQQMLKRAASQHSGSPSPPLQSGRRASRNSMHPSTHTSSTSRHHHRSKSGATAASRSQLPPVSTSSAMSSGQRRSKSVSTRSPIAHSPSSLSSHPYHHHHHYPSKSKSPVRSNHHGGGQSHGHHSTPHSRSASIARTHHHSSQDPSRSSRAGSTSTSTTPTATSQSSSTPANFVNFTPSDSHKILGGVAPSGSSKTKARREKEASEKRKRLSEAAAKAVLDAGGDLRDLQRDGVLWEEWDG